MARKLGLKSLRDAVKIFQVIADENLCESVHVFDELGFFECSGVESSLVLNMLVLAYRPKLELSRDQYGRV